MQFFSAIKKKLEWEVLIIIAIILILGFGILTFLTIKRNTRNLLKLQNEKINSMSVTMIESLNNIMLTGNAPMASGWFKEIQKNLDVKRVQIFKKDGNVAFRDNKTVKLVNKHMGGDMFTEIYRNNNKEPVVLDMSKFNHVLETNEKVIYFENIDDEEVVTQLTPIENKARCKICHGYDTHRVRAVLRVSHPIKDIRSAISSSMWEIIIISLSTLMLIIVVIGVLLDSIVLKPIKSMLNSVSLFAKGDLTKRVEVESENEIKELAMGIDMMCESLKDILKRIVYGATQIGSSAESLSISSAKIASDAQNRNGSVSFVANVFQKMNDDILEVTRNSSEVAEIANESHELALKGDEISREALSKMKSGVNVAESDIKLAKKISHAFRDVAAHSKKVNTMIQQVAETLKGQLVVSNQIKGDIDQVETITKKTAVETEQITEATQKIANLASELQLSVVMFKVSKDGDLSDEKFKEELDSRIMTIEWTGNLSTGIGWQDQQHMELFDRINSLLDAMKQRKGVEEVDKIIKYLDDYVIYHFEKEEACMEEYGYAGYSFHKKEHTAFINGLSNIKKEIERQGGITLTIAIQIQNNICDWLINHIGDVDKKLGAFLKNRKQG